MSHTNLEKSNDQSGVSNNMRVESALAYTPESQSIYRMVTSSRNKPVSCVPDLTLVDEFTNEKEPEKGSEVKHCGQWRVGNAVFRKTV